MAIALRAQGDDTRVMFRCYIRSGGGGMLWFSLVASWLAAFAQVASSRAQTILNVTNFGARGDAVQVWVNTVSNSAVVLSTNQFSSADVGKVMMLFGAGAYTTPTNNQDLLVTIVTVLNGTNVSISSVAGA